MLVEWKGGLDFDATGRSGQTISLHGSPGGPTPVEALLASIGGCIGMDVVSILLKKRQEVTGYTIEVEHDRVTDGDWPKPVTEVRLHHKIEGKDIDHAAVARAIELSETKYCSVQATIRISPPVVSRFTVSEKD